MKTIDELNEITTLDTNTYVPVSRGGGETVKYNLTNLNTELQNVYNYIGNLHEQFSTSKIYYPGQFVQYQNKIYKFIQLHPAGAWNPNEVEEASIFQEFQGLDEKVTISISGLSDLGNKTILVYVEGEPNPRNLTTDSLGQAETVIRKGLTYDIYPQPYGSYIVQNYLNIKAALSDRYINIPYQLEQTETCTVEVNIVTNNLSDFTGSEFTIFNESNQQALTATIDNTGKATFNNAIKYTTYIINSTGIVPRNNTYRKPANSTILTNLDTNVINLDYRNVSYGIFLVNGTTWEETEITTEFIATLDNTMKSTYPYIHVCTEELANAGCDYYVRCRDLTSERLATEVASKQWSTRGVEYPHVSTNTTTEYNGRNQTYYMLNDPFTSNLGCYSPAAMFACNQSIEVNGELLKGYIGTVAQMKIIYNNDTTTPSTITSALNKIGYSNINFLDYKDTWSSIQSGSMGYNWAGGYRVWRTLYGEKAKALLVVPFFSK